MLNKLTDYIFTTIGVAAFGALVILGGALLIAFAPLWALLVIDD